MMQVIRLEHRVHRSGPYGGSNKAKPLYETGNGQQPLPDFRVPDPAYVFGFITTEQANRWWDDRARACASMQDYAVAVYEVPEDVVLADNNQCVFDPRIAKLIAHIDPKEWVGGDLDYLLQAKVFNDANQQRRQSSGEQPLVCTLNNPRSPRPNLGA